MTMGVVDKRNTHKKHIYFKQLNIEINPPTVAELYQQVTIEVKISQLPVIWLLTQMCTQGHFILVFTVILTTLNNTRWCFNL